MKKSLFIIAFIAFAGTVFSFTRISTPEITFGTFGGDGVTAPKIELNADHTFHYVDNTKPSNPIDITGKWEVSDDQIHLLDVNNKKVMDELEISREGKCLKARKGMAFYTLCNCN